MNSNPPLQLVGGSYGARAMKVLIFALTSVAILLSGCEREKRDFRPDPPQANVGSDFFGADRVAATYQDNAYHLAQGKMLFKWFNCTGCHSRGGGGMGPALMDNEWLYGGGMSEVVASIREGRPNGMPSFRGKIPDGQIWQIAAYVRSMSGNAPSSAAPQRDDAMSDYPSESRRSAQPPLTNGPIRPGEAEQ